MSTNTVKGNLKELSGKIKQQWGKLTDNDITQINGSVEELQGKLQKAYGYQQDQAKKEIDRFMKDNNVNA